MIDRPAGEKPASFLRPNIDEDVPVRKTTGQHKPAEEDLSSPLEPATPMVKISLTFAIFKLCHFHRYISKIVHLSVKLL